MGVKEPEKFGKTGLKISSALVHACKTVPINLKGMEMKKKKKEEEKLKSHWNCPLHNVIIQVSFQI